LNQQGNEIVPARPASQVRKPASRPARPCESGIKGWLDPAGINLTDCGAAAICQPIEVFMNKIRFRFLVATVALVLSAGAIQAQTSLQKLTFSLLGQYETNTFYTNSDSPPLTNEYSQIRTILITTGDVVKALAVDLEGTNWNKFSGGSLFYAVNLTNGAEGMLLRNGTNEADVSSFFGGTFSNNFTGQLTNEFHALNTNLAFAFTNIMTNVATNGSVTNIFTNVFTNLAANGAGNNFAVESPLFHGWRRMTDATTTTTNFWGTAGIYFISLNTTNIKFNLLGVGNGSATNLTGHIDGTAYERTNVDSEFLGTAGSFYLNVETNIYNMGTNPPVFVTGPMHGSVNINPPGFSSTVTPP
jgi:hypothetical protein